MLITMCGDDDYEDYNDVEGPFRICSHTKSGLLDFNVFFSSLKSQIGENQFDVHGTWLPPQCFPILNWQEWKCFPLFQVCMVFTIIILLLVTTSPFLFKIHACKFKQKLGPKKCLSFQIFSQNKN